MRWRLLHTAILITISCALFATTYNVVPDMEHPILIELRSGGDSLNFDLIYHNQETAPFSGVLHFSSPFIRYVKIKTGQGNTTSYTSGTTFRFSQRPFPTRDFGFPIHVNSGDTIKINVMLDNAGFSGRVPVKLWSAESWEKYRNRRNFILTGYVSVNIFALIFGFIVLTTIRAHFRYSFIYYFSVGLLLVVTLEGLAFRYLWPGAPLVQQISFYLLLNAGFLGSFRFLQRFFRTHWKLPTVDRIIYVLMVGLGILAACALAGPWLSRSSVKIVELINHFWFLVCAAVFIATPILYYARTKNIESVWFLIAYIPHMISIIFATLQGMGLIWFPRYYEVLVWIGIVNLHTVLSILILFRVRGVVRKQAQTRINLERERAGRLRDLVLQEEMERERIGADLHDEAGSRFAGIKMGLSRLAYREREPALKKSLDNVIGDVDKICELNRSISHQLLSVSLNKAGLREALREYQSRLRKRGRLVGFMHKEGTLEGLSESAGILVYRVILELVDGIYEDLSAFRIQIEDVKVSSELLLTVESIDGESLPAVDQESITLNSLRTRLALFNTSRDESLQFTKQGVLIWLPKIVETGVV